MTDELERIWKEAVVVEFMEYGLLSGSTEEIDENPVRAHPEYESTEYCYANLLR
jgi:hypothetical protein